jgi:CheY-like chemotaxis protein/HPt (histidine-containing phosphotransfer) domain-containing protein
VALFSHSAVERGSELMVDLRPDVPRGVKGDPTRLRQVLSNLVGNAVKFTQDGEILVSVSRGGGTDEEPRVRFSVRDTGVGIPKDKQEAIFQEFTQADSSTTRHYGGTGLGLTISRHLVSLMGGELRLESDEGVGSEFYFTLDLPVDPDYAPAPEPGARIDLTGVKALIVDDLETNRRIFRDFLETAGARVQVTESATEALNLLRTLQGQDPFDFVILDLLMPGRDGFQLAEDIRLDPDLRDLPLMVLTSSNRPGDRKLAARLRIEGFLQKPVSRAELLRGVHGVLGERLANVGGGEGGGVSVPEEVGRRAPTVPEPAWSRELTEGLKVLVAEDNLVNQQVAMGLLRRWGCEVRMASNGVEALEFLEEEAPDLILMDVQMPEMDGLEATRLIRADPHHHSIPILALTAHVLPEERQRCEDAGMSDYIPKPFKPGELRERVEHWAQVVGGMAGGEAAHAGISTGENVVGASEDPARGDPGPQEAKEVEPGEEAEPDQGEQGREGPRAIDMGSLDLDMSDLPDAHDLAQGGPEDRGPPVLLEEFRAVMRDAGIESVVDAAVAAYLDETPRRMEALETAVEEGDLAAVEREAHGIKSGSRNIRADELAKQLEAMEAAGREGRGEDVLSAMPGLRDSFNQVMDYLKRQGPASS